MAQGKGGCGSWFLGIAILVGVAAYVATSTDIGKQFVRKWTRGAGNKEKTLAYWNGIKNNYLTQAVSASAGTIGRTWATDPSRRTTSASQRTG